MSRPMSAGRRSALVFTAVASIALPIIVGAVNATPLVIAGQDNSTPVAFEVASIKRSDAGNEGPRFLNWEPGGRVRVVNQPVTTMVSMAYGVQSYQIIDAPPWANSDGYDIVAKAPEGVALNINTFRPMMQALLRERFQLRLRRETRALPIYNLVFATRDRTLGAKLTRSAIDCTGRTAPPSNPAQLKSCGAYTRPGGFTLGGMPMGAFVRLLSPAVNRVVVDQTELEGNWDLEVSYTPELVPAADVGAVTPLASGAPTLFTALQEQLGLKLDAGRGPVEVIVIESVSRPTEN